MRILLIIFFLTAPIFRCFSNVRNCLLLPVELNSYNSDQVFNKVEMYLKRSNWCVFQNSTQLYDLLKPYASKNIDFVSNLEVLQLITLKTSSKSIIRLDESGDLIRLRVLDGTENPTFIANFERNKLTTIDVLIQEIVKSLDSYSKLIPYDGIVLGRNQNIVTISSGKEFGFKKGLSVNFLRNLTRKNHPLYKFVVDYDYEKFCSGVVLQSDFGMSIVEINEAENKSCDSVLRNTLVKKERFSDNFKKISIIKRKSNPIFSFKPGLELGSSSLILNNNGKTILSGVSTNLNTEVTARLTEKYFFLSGLRFGLNALSVEEGSASDQSPISTEISFGLRYQISNIKKTKINFDALIKFFNIFLTNDSISSISKFNHNSLNLITDITHRFNNRFTGVLGLGFSLLSSAEFESGYLGSVESSNRYSFNVGGWIDKVYMFRLYTGLSVNSININFNGQDKDVQYTDLSLNSSLIFKF